MARTYTRKPKTAAKKKDDVFDSAFGKANKQKDAANKKKLQAMYGKGSLKTSLVKKTKKKK